MNISHVARSVVAALSGNVHRSSAGDSRQTILLGSIHNSPQPPALSVDSHWQDSQLPSNPGAPRYLRNGSVPARPPTAAPHHRSRLPLPPLAVSSLNSPRQAVTSVHRPRRSELHTHGLLREQMRYAGTAHAPQARERHPLKINAAGDIGPALQAQAPHVQTSPSHAVVEAFPAHLGHARSNLAQADATGFADGGNEWETWSDADYSDEELRSFQARFDEEDRQMAALDGQGADTPPVPAPGAAPVSCEQNTADATGFEDGGNEWEAWSDADYSDEELTSFQARFDEEDRQMAALDGRNVHKPPLAPKPVFMDGSWRRSGK